MIPSDPDTIAKMEAVADRNIANGDWGDEVRLPLEDAPLSQVERDGKDTVVGLLSKNGSLPLPKRNSS